MKPKFNVYQALLFGLFIYPPDSGVNSPVVNFQMKTEYFADQGKKCRKVIETLPASRYAKALNLSVAEAYQNHKIPLFRQPSSEKLDDKVGYLLPGSRSEILEETNRHFKVKSSIDGSVGWISREDVHRTLWENSKTGLSCH